MHRDRAGGRMDVPYLWGFSLGISGVFLHATLLVLDDDLAQERFRPSSQGADAVALKRIRLSALATVVIPASDRFAGLPL